MSLLPFTEPPPSDTPLEPAPVHPTPRVDLRRGTMWMIFSLVFFTGNSLLIKHMATDRHIDPWLIVSFRFGVGLFFTAAIFLPAGTLSVRRSFMSWLLASRGVMGAFATAAYYFSIGPLGAGKSTLIGNTWCVWSAIMATVVLKEHLSFSKLLGILIAVGGLMLLMDLSPAALAVNGKWEAVSLGGAVVAAAVVVVVRQLTKTETSPTIFASQCIYGLLLCVPMALCQAIHLTALDIGLLCLAGLCAAVGQLSMTEGFRFLTIAAGGAFQLTLPLVIALGGVLLFNETFSLPQMLGAGLILLGSFQTIAGGRWGKGNK